MKTYLSILIIASFLLQSCQNDENLGDNYHVLSGYEAKDVGYPYGAIIYKSNQKYSFKEVIIYSDVIAYKSDDAYIIILQKPNKEIMRNIIIDNIKYLSNKKNVEKIEIEFPHGNINSKNLYYQLDSLTKISLDSSISYNEMANSILEREPFYKNQFRQTENYFVIDKQKTIIKGPLNLKEFIRLKEEKNIDLEF